MHFASRRTFASAALVFLILAAALAASAPSNAQRRRRTPAPATAPAGVEAEYDLLIRGGRVVDGTGRRALVADVAVRGDRVVRVGRVPASARTRSDD